jgi:hypothetical protein
VALWPESDSKESSETASSAAADSKGTVSALQAKSEAKSDAKSGAKLEAQCSDAAVALDPAEEERLADIARRLFAAARSGDVKTGRLLLWERTKFRSHIHRGDPDACGLTALGHAAQRGHTDFARLLLEAGADVHRLNCAGPGSAGFVAESSSRGQGGDSPLHWAALCGHVDTARLLLDNGAEVNRPDALGWYWFASSSSLTIDCVGPVLAGCRCITRLRRGTSRWCAC